MNERLKRHWDLYGGTLMVSREGRCRKCGTRIDDLTRGHGSFADMGSGGLCQGRPKGPFRYVLSVAITGRGRDPEEVPWLADDLAALRKRAVKERRSLYVNVKGSRD